MERNVGWKSDNNCLEGIERYVETEYKEVDKHTKRTLKIKLAIELFNEKISSMYERPNKSLIFGVCSELEERIGIHRYITRILFLLTLSMGSFVIYPFIYFLFWLEQHKKVKDILKLKTYEIYEIERIFNMKNLAYKTQKFAIDENVKKAGNLIMNLTVEEFKLVPLVEKQIKDIYNGMGW